MLRELRDAFGVDDKRLAALSSVYVDVHGYCL